MASNNHRLSYQEHKTLEPIVRASTGTNAVLADQASKLLKHPVTEAQIWYFRTHVLELPPPIARWKFSPGDIQRLTELVQREPHVVLHRGRKRLYMTTFEMAMKQRKQCLKNRIWEKAAVVNGLARTSASDR